MMLGLGYLSCRSNVAPSTVADRERDSRVFDLCLVEAATPMMVSTLRQSALLEPVVRRRRRPEISSIETETTTSC